LVLSLVLSGHHQQGRILLGPQKSTRQQLCAVPLEALQSKAPPAQVQELLGWQLKEVEVLDHLHVCTTQP
jgi:hypothetical protein